MRNKLLAILVLVLLLGAASTGKVVAAETSNAARHEVRWDSVNGDKFQVYFNEVGSSQVNTVFNGLSRDSHSVTLSYLKACTQYSWSLKAYVNGVWSWKIRDSRFTTDGACSSSRMRNPRGPVVKGPVLGATTDNVVSYMERTRGQKAQNDALAQQYGQAQNSQTISYQQFMKSAAGQALGVNVGGADVLGATTCSSNGKATVALNKPKNVTIDKIHVYYGVGGKWQHAVRNLSGKADAVTINYLNTCANYSYRVQVVDVTGKSWWMPSYSMKMGW